MSVRGMVQPDALDGNEEGLGASHEMLLSEVDLFNPEQAVAYAGAWFRNESRRKQRLEREWLEAIEFLRGNHWGVWDEDERRWATNAPKLAHRVRYVGNICLAYALTAQAKLLRNRPILEVDPATGDAEDFEIAGVSRQVIRCLWDKLHMHARVVPSFAGWFILAGTAGVKAYFDPEAGPKMRLSEQDTMLLPPELKKRLEEGVGDRLTMGEAAAEPLSPFHLYPDPDAESWDDMPILLDARRRSLDYIRSAWPKTGRKVSPEGKGDTDAGRSRARHAEHDGGQRATARVLDLWVRPCRWYPDGAHVTVAGNQLLQAQPLPEWCGGEIPYYVDVDVEVPGELWGSSIYRQIMPINKSRNRAFSQIIEVANLTANPPLLVPAGCRLDEKSITTKPGERWVYFAIGGQKPEWLPPPPLPEHAKTLPDVLERDIGLVSGMNEPTMSASAPTNVRTASGLAQLIKEDDSRLAVRAERVAGVLSRAGACLLRIVASEYDLERTGKIAGDKNNFEVLTFKGQDIVGRNIDVPGANYYDVRVRVDTGHTSKTAKSEQLLNLVTAGLIDVQNPDERRWVLRSLDWGLPDDEQFDELRRVEIQALVENRMLAQVEDDQYAELQASEVMGPHSWDDHQVHERIHQDFMRRGDFTKLPRERRLRFEEHVLAHTLAMQEAAMKAALTQGPMPGSPGAPPPAAGQPASRPGMPELPNEGMPRGDGPPAQGAPVPHTPFAA